MAFEIGSLEPIIHRILSAPGTDLATISAKRVRKQLVEEAALSPEAIKEQKGEIDALIARVFERVNAEQQQEEADDSDDESAGEESYTSRKRQHNDDEEDEGEDDMASPPPAKKAKKAKNGSKLSDEALARKLSNEINGRSTRTGKAGTTKARVGSNKAKARKSAATIDSDEDSDTGSKKRKPRKRASSTGGGGAKGGFAKEFILSEPLAAVVQAERMSRPQVVKQLWVYIKDNELQNPSDKREIICDPRLKAVFGKDKVTMFSMNKYLGQNLHEPET